MDHYDTPGEERIAMLSELDDIDSSSDDSEIEIQYSSYAEIEVHYGSPS